MKGDAKKGEAMKRVLVVDDDPIRHDYFRVWLHGRDAWHVYSVPAAVHALRSRTFELVFLDHDMNEFAGGQQVARAICDLEQPPALVVVHSWNPGGAMAIEAILGRGNVRCVRRQFGGDLKAWLALSGLL